MKTIKEQLNAGMTPKQLLDDLNKQIIAAQREIDEENARKEKQTANIAAAEKNVVDAMETYFVALGAAPRPNWREEFSKTLSTLSKVYGILTTKTEEDDPCDIKNYSIKGTKTVNGRKSKMTEDEINDILTSWKDFFN